MKAETKSRETYHHGNLPEVLIREGAELLAEKGIDGFSMREVARRAGVAVAAPSHHFGSAKGLLTAVATEGFERLSGNLEQALENSGDPENQVIAICRTYVEMGVHDPGYAVIMFRLDLLDYNDPVFRERSFHAFGLLSAALQEAVPQGVKAEQIGYAAKTLWSAMHGLVALEMIEQQETDDLIRFVVRTLLAGMQCS